LSLIRLSLAPPIIFNKKMIKTKINKQINKQEMMSL
jgi:hypothetical protein